MAQVTLFPHQLPMVARHVALLKSRGVTSDRSETGVGKTPRFSRQQKTWKCLSR